MKNAYYYGFIKGMKDCGDGKATFEEREKRLTEVYENHTDEYHQGYCDAVMHWNGYPIGNRAHDMGLVVYYKEYWGQSDFSHPA